MRLIYNFGYYCIVMYLYSEDLLIFLKDFKQLILHLEEKCEHFMRLYINQLINTDDWRKMLSSEHQERIKEGMFQSD